MKPVLKDTPATLLAHAARGAAIGAANTVPGVSGGTIAVVTGIYDRLVTSIGDLFSSRWRSHLLFLLPVFTGIILGIAGFAWVIDTGLTRAPEQTFFFFVGLIAGSVPFVFNQVRHYPIRIGDVLLAGAAFAILLVQALLGDPPISDPITTVSATTVLPLLVAGVLATGTMIIPGVSGSFVLLIIGMYSTFLQAVRQGTIPVLAVLIIGAIGGLILVSRLMSILLHRFHRRTYWFILGLVVGSIVGIWPGISSVTSALLDVVAAAIGVGLAWTLGKRPRPGPPELEE